MSTIFQDITDALNAGVLAVFPTTPIAWENILYDPIPDTPYVRPTVIVHRSLPEGLGPSGLIRHSGVLQVSLYYPLGEGMLDMLTAGDVVASALKRGTDLISGSAVVRVESVARAMVLYDKAWAHLPITITWVCFATA